MAEPLVLLPGMMCDARVFQPQFTALSRDLPVMVAPLRGERIEEIASEIVTAAPPKFALAGLGLGGCVAMEVLRRAPERVTRIALMGASPLAETPAEAADRDPQIVRARSGRLADVLDEVMPSSALAPGTGRVAVTNLLREMWKDLGPDTFVRQSRAMQRRKDQQATLRKCRVQALLLCGASDTLVPVKRHEFMAELVPHAELVVLEGAGHMPTLEQPEAVTEALRTWLKLPFVLK